MQISSLILAAFAVLASSVLASEDPTGKLDGVLDLSMASLREPLWICSYFMHANMHLKFGDLADLLGKRVFLWVYSLLVYM